MLFIVRGASPDTGHDVALAVEAASAAEAEAEANSSGIFVSAVETEASPPAAGAPAPEEDAGRGEAGRAGSRRAVQRPASVCRGWLGSPGRRRLATAACLVAVLVPLLAWWVSVKDGLFVAARPTETVAPPSGGAGVLAGATDAADPVLGAGPGSAGGVRREARAAPPRPVPPPDAPFGAPQAAEAVVDAELAPTSGEYGEVGFREFRFGMARADVDALAGPLGDARAVPGWMADGALNLYKFDDDGRLRATMRRYVGDNEGRLAAIRETFGRARQDRVRTAHRYEPAEDHLVDTTEVEYVFPSVFAVAEADDERIGRSSSERLFLSVYDRSWLRAVLVGHGREVEKLLSWAAAHAVPALSGPGADVEGMGAPPGLKAEYFGPGRPAKFKWWPNGLHSEATAFSNDRGPALVVERAVEDFPGGTRYQRKGGVRIRVSCAPVWRAASPTLDRSTNSVIARVESGIAQGVFPPAGDNVVWHKLNSETVKAYEWETAAGWKVIVERSDIYLINAPKARL